MPCTNGTVLQSADALGELTNYVYDPQSNVVQTRDANNVGFDAVYDGLGRQTSVTDTQGDTTLAGYDRGGNMTSTTDAKSKVTSFAYNALDRHVSTTDRNNRVTSQIFDKNGNMTSITDAENRTTAYEYNARNEKIKETYPDHTGGNPGDATYGIIEFAYDPAGRLQLRTDQNGDTQTPVYDMASRLLQRDYRTKANSPSGTIADSDVMTYDAASRLLTGYSGRYNNTIGRAYDNAGRLATESLTIAGRTYTVSHEYDVRSLRKKTTYPNGSTWERTYTGRLQLHQTKYNGNTVDTRGYDDGGRHTSSAYANGVTNNFAYRNDNLLSSISHTHPGGTADNRKVGTYNYSWDVNKNKTKETIVGQLAGYSFDTTLGANPTGYDDEDRLTYYKRQNTTDPQTWTLSLVGNWATHDNFGVVQDRTHSPAHEINTITSGGAALIQQHDVKGNTTYAALDAMSLGHTFGWDFDNQLVGVDVTGDQVPDVSYEYDVLRRRVARTPALGTGQVYVYAGEQIVADYERGAVAASTPTYRYVWGSYIDEPILRQASDGETLYFHRNQQYSTTALTNASGLVVERYAYTAYGQLKVMTHTGGSKSWSDNSNRYLYTGREWDAGTQLYHFRARQYSPHLGRFVSRDTLGYVDGMSLYRAYFGVKRLDPFGMRTNDLSGRARETVFKHKHDDGIEYPIFLIVDGENKGKCFIKMGETRFGVMCRRNAYLVADDDGSFSAVHKKSRQFQCKEDPSLKGVIETLEKQISEHDCIDGLVITSHGTLEGDLFEMSRGGAAAASEVTNILDAKGVTRENARQYFDEIQKKVKFCSPCQIWLIACFSGMAIDNEDNLLRQIHEATGCTVYAPKAYSFLHHDRLYGGYPRLMVWTSRILTADNVTVDGIAVYPKGSNIPPYYEIDIPEEDYDLSYGERFFK